MQRTIFNLGHVAPNGTTSPNHTSELSMLSEQPNLIYALLNQLSDAVVIESIPGHISSWNVGAEKMFGYTAQEMIGRSTLLLIPQDGVEAAAQLLEHVAAGHIATSQAIERKHKAGHRMPLEMSAIPIRNRAQNVVGVIKIFRPRVVAPPAQDAPEVSPSQYIKRERIFRSIAASIPGMAIIMLDYKHRYLMAEGELITNFGYTKKQLLGNRMEDVLPPDRFALLRSKLERVFKGETFSDHMNRGSLYMNIRYVPVLNAQRQAYAAMMVIFDVTELKKTQLALSRMNNSLEHLVKERTDELTEANEELQALSYSVSHDLRAPLRAIMGYSVMLQEDYANSLDDNGNRLLSVLQSNATRMNQRISDLLTFARLGQTEIQRTTTDITRLASIIAGEIQVTYPNTTIKVSPLHPALADKALLTQVFSHYLSNAAKYASKKSNPHIQISSWVDDQFIVYAIEDNGQGFDMKYADKLFKVFQRLHSLKEFEGSGVGLAIVRTIIKKHGGHVWAESEPDKGATFYFSLPVAPPS